MWLFWLRIKANKQKGTRSPRLINVSVCVLFGDNSPTFHLAELSFFPRRAASFESFESFECALYQSLAPDNLPRDMRPSASGLSVWQIVMKKCFVSALRAIVVAAGIFHFLQLAAFEQLIKLNPISAAWQVESGKF